MILVRGLIKLFSIEYFAPIPTPITVISIPILLIRFSPINFSRLDLPFGRLIFFSEIILGSSCKESNSIGVVVAVTISTALSITVASFSILTS